MAQGSVDKGKLILLDSGGNEKKTIDVQFNPIEFTKLWNLTWVASSGGPPQYTATTPGDFVLTLQFDTYEKQTDVSVKTADIRSLIDPKTSGNYGCIFQWGKAVYKGRVTNLSEKFTLFLPDGRPVRSNLTITLQSWPDDLQNG